MKYAVTGHTAGIGKALQKATGAIGFSKSTGYDICDRSARMRILDECVDVDILINSACEGFGQTQLLLDYFCRFKDQKKTIINVGSNVTGAIISEDNLDLLYYQMYKKSLKTLVADLSYIPSNLSIKYVSFGYVGTDRILAKYPHLTSYLTIDEAVERILGVGCD